MSQLIVDHRAKARLRRTRCAKQRRRSSGRAVLGGNGASAEVRALIPALGSDDGTLRHRARESLTAMGKPAVRPLMEALQHPDERVRWEVAKALGEIHDKTAAAALVLTLEDESFGIRWLAAEGLVAFGRYTLPPLLRALVKRADSIWLREGALHILHLLAHQGLGDETRPVVAALEGPAPTVAVPLAAGDAIERLRGARRHRGSLKAAAKMGGLSAEARDGRLRSNNVGAVSMGESEICADREGLTIDDAGRTDVAT
jgi:HEAT repeat protein